MRLRDKYQFVRVWCVALIARMSRESKLGGIVVEQKINEFFGDAEPTGFGRQEGHGCPCPYVI